MGGGRGDFRVDNHNVRRVHPHDRDYLSYDRPPHFYSNDYHYYGYRVNYLPPRYRRIRSYGIDYYLYNGIYYRPYDSYYVVCRPPFGTSIGSLLVASALNAVNFAYYTNVYRTYRAIDSYNDYIDEQNRTIARNNQILASQNNQMALNLNRASDAYSLANQLGLIQSYAYANQEYYYQDGVFYIIDRNGEYTVITPPAGALVNALPDDYQILTMNGREYYQVDNTVYDTTVEGGVPYLEVLGQLPYSRSSAYYRSNNTYNSGTGLFN